MFYLILKLYLTPEVMLEYNFLEAHYIDMHTV